MSESGRSAWEPPDASPTPPSLPQPSLPQPSTPEPSFPRYAYPPASQPAPRPAYPGAGYQVGGYPGGGYPGSGYQGPYPAVVARGPGLPRPIAIEVVPGTPFGVAVVEVRPTTSGPASASLVAGIASILVALIVGCFAVVGAEQGWGALVAGAFAALSATASVAAIWLCRIALTRVRRSVVWGPTRGRGLAIAGLVCGLVGLTLSVLVILVALLA
jgi:hypothetical protein